MKLKTQGYYPLSDLLPYRLENKKEKEIRKVLSEYDLLLHAAEQTQRSLSLGDLNKFDAIVGENMCQIRALQIAMGLSKATKEFNDQKEPLKEKRRMITYLTTHVQKGSANKLFQEQKLEIFLSSRQLFFVQAYLLTVVKVSNPPKKETPLIGNDTTQTSKLKSLGNVSGSFCHSLVKKLREHVSLLSIAFIEKCASALADKLLPRIDRRLVWQV